MKAQLLAATAVVALSAGGAWAQSSDRTVSDLTRDLNSLPSSAVVAPVSPPPAPVATPAPAPAPTVTPPPSTQAAPPPAAPHQTRPAQAATPAPASSTTTSTLNTTTYGPPATPVAPPPAATPRPTTPAPAAAAPAPTPRPTTPAPTATPPATTSAPRPAPTTNPAPSAAASVPAAATPAPTPAPAAATAALDATAISALPFRINLPPGFVIVPGRAGPNAQIYSVKRGEETFAMIYTGASSQFPIYDGQMVQAAGRTSIVITEDGRRTAAEHLFQRSTAPEEVHVWISSLDGADRVMAEGIAQSVDVR